MGREVFGEMGQGGHHRKGGKAPQRAKAAVFHRLAQVGQDGHRAPVAARDDVIVALSVSTEDAKTKFGDVTVVLPYLRTIKQPAA